MPWPEYKLAGLFHTPLASEDAVRYRQEVLRDLEQAPVLAAIRSFTQRLLEMRRQLLFAAKCQDTHERNRWHLGAAQRYGQAAIALHQDLASLSLGSRGLRRWCAYLGQHIASQAFQQRMAQAAQVQRALADIHYAVTIDGGNVIVQQSDDQADYTAEVEACFAKFRRGAVKDYQAKLPVTVGLNHIEAQVLEGVARLNPEGFARLSAFCQEHPSFVDPRVERFDRELHFYLGWLDYIEPLRRAGLPFCRPAVSARSKSVAAHGAYDLALARRLLAEHGAVVGNDFSLQGDERMIVVTGPNHGGKTTFARMIGQLHWQVSLGLSVPAADAQLFLFDRMFSHFEREEDINTLRGKLHDDLVRVQHILAQATPASIVVINEIFSSTTLEDALYLGREILQRLERLNLLAVCVTFLDELAGFSPTVVSMVTASDPADPAARSFKLERRPADGLAHALAIAEKHHVTAAWLKQRIAP